MSEMFEQLREKIKTKARAARLIRRGEQVHIRDSGVGSSDTIELQMETTSISSGGKEDEEKDEGESDTGSGGSKTSDVFLPSLPPKIRATSPEVTKQRRFLMSDKDEVKMTSHGAVEFVSDATRIRKQHSEDGSDFQLPSFAKTHRQVSYRLSEPPPDYSSPISPPVPLSTHPTSPTPPSPFANSTRASNSPQHGDTLVPPPPPPPPPHSTAASQQFFDCDEQYDYQPLSSRTRIPVSVYEPLDSPKNSRVTRKDSYTTMLPSHTPTQQKNMFYNTK